MIGLPAAQVGKHIDWGNESSDESDFIPLLMEGEESLPRSYYGYTYDDVTGVTYEPTDEAADFEFLRTGFGLRNPPSVRVDDMIVSHLCDGG